MPDLVILGGDHPPSRLAVQRDGAPVIVNGATEAAVVCISQQVRMDPELPCLECITPPEDPEDTGPIATLGPVYAITGLLQAVEAAEERVPARSPYRIRGFVWISALRPDSAYGIRVSRPPRR